MSNPIQNFYKSTITNDWSIGTGNFYVSVKPTTSVGRLVVSPSSDTLREIIEYTSTGTDSNGDYIVVSARGVGGTTEQTHTVGEKVRMNITAEDWEDMRDDIDSIVVAGAPNASTTERGIVQKASLTDFLNGTDIGSTGAPLFISPNQISKQKVTITSSSTPTINTDTCDNFLITAQSQDITSFTTNLSGTPKNGNNLNISIVSDNEQTNSTFEIVSAVGIDTAGATSILASIAVPLKNYILFAEIISSDSYSNSVPSGWNLIAQQRSGAYHALYYKIATSSETGTYTWGFASSQKINTVVYSARGYFDTVNPIESYSSVPYTTSDTSVIASSVNTTSANQPVLYFGSNFNNGSSLTMSITTPSLFTEIRGYASNDSDMGIETAYYIKPTVGSTGNITGTIPTSIPGKHAFAVVLKKGSYNASFGTSFNSLNKNIIGGGLNEFNFIYSDYYSKWIINNPIPTSGIFSKVSSDTTTTTIAHGLGKIPKKIRLKSEYGTTTFSTSDGFWSEYNSYCLWRVLKVSSTEAGVVNNSTTYSIILADTTAGTSYLGGIVSVDETNIYISWIKVGSPTSTFPNIAWEAE